MKIKEILIPLSIITVLCILAVIISIITALYVLTAVININGMERQAIVDCYTWQRYERDFPLFELQEREVKMCKELGIDIK